ncbi:MAG: hypothetical protein GX436_08985 [Synergistaceae bacterium]|nr:hypothetical protein [Synergistaceae bacterium]
MDRVKGRILASRWSRIFFWVSILIALAWGLQPFFIRAFRWQKGLETTVAVSGGKSEIFLLAFLVVCGGLLFWVFLERLFWRKYFPTQEMPDPPAKTGLKEKGSHR